MQRPGTPVQRHLVAGNRRRIAQRQRGDDRTVYQRQLPKAIAQPFPERVEAHLRRWRRAGAVPTLASDDVALPRHPGAHEPAIAVEAMPVCRSSWGPQTNVQSPKFASAHPFAVEPAQQQASRQRAVRLLGRQHEALHGHAGIQPLTGRQFDDAAADEGLGAGSMHALLNAPAGMEGAPAQAEQRHCRHAQTLRWQTAEAEGQEARPQRLQAGQPVRQDSAERERQCLIAELHAKTRSMAKQSCSATSEASRRATGRAFDKRATAAWNDPRRSPMLPTKPVAASRLSNAATVDQQVSAKQRDDSSAKLSCACAKSAP